ncbi:MAG: hypothetical protein MJ187_01610 [Alphaproteobacteria bacterium]|nr:hypothetical protein [Alphaproteobacteria bacterium]
MMKNQKILEELEKELKYWYKEKAAAEEYLMLLDPDDPSERQNLFLYERDVKRAESNIDRVGRKIKEIKFKEIGNILGDLINYKNTIRH